MNPVNNVPFTIHALQQLSKFIESDLVREKQWFCDYDKQALKDAVMYLNQLETHYK